MYPIIGCESMVRMDVYHSDMIDDNLQIIFLNYNALTEFILITLKNLLLFSQFYNVIAWSTWNNNTEAPFLT